MCQSCLDALRACMTRLAAALKVLTEGLDASFFFFFFWKRSQFSATAASFTERPGEGSPPMPALFSG